MIPTEKPPTKAAFLFIFITVALDMLALGIIVPVLPKLILHFEAGDMSRASVITGIFGTVWAAMQFIFSPVLGSLSDRFGRRPVILLSNLGLGLDYVFMALAPTLPWLFVGRVISGITASSFSTAGAYIADVTAPKDRAGRFGMLGAAFGLGFILGPAVGGMLGAIDLRLPFWAAGGLSLVNAAYGFFILPESLPSENRTPFHWRKANPIGSLKLLRSHPELAGLALATLLYYIAHESLPSVFVLYTDYRYQWGARTVGVSLAAVGLCSAIVSAGVIRPMVRRLGESRTLFAGLLFGAAGFATYGLAPTSACFAAGIPLVALWGLAGPASQALMTTRISPSEQGRLQGALSSLRGISGMLGPILFTNVFAAAVHGHPASPWSGSPYLLASALLLASLIVSWKAISPPPKVS